MSGNFDRFKKYTSSGVGNTNPKKEKVKVTYTMPDIDTEDLGNFDMTNVEKDKTIMSTALLNGQNKYLFAQLLLANKEIKDLKQDIASLFLMITEGEKNIKFTPEEGRQVYMDFKMDKKHIINRLVK